MKKIMSLMLAGAMVVSMAGCGAKTEEAGTAQSAATSAAAAETQAETAAAGTVADGTYSVESTGMHDGMKLDVTFKDGKITEVKVVEHGETEGISEPALERIPQEITANNSVNVDAVAGATMTSNGIIEGVKMAIEAAGGKVEDFNTVSQEEVVKEAVEKTADVVIAGGGLTGLTTAIAAAENGLDVILVEKMPQTGGSLALANGSFINIESEAGKRLGFTETQEELLGLWHQTAEYGPDEPDKYPNFDRVEAMIAEAGTQLSWLEEHGVEFHSYTPMTEFHPSMLITDGGNSVASVLTESAKEAGVEIMLETPAIELIVEDGKVVGLKAESRTEEITVKAPNVVLATGGIGNSPELIHEFMPQFDDFVAQIAPGHTGDGIRMAQEAGAAVYDNYWVLTTNLTALPEFTKLAPEAAALSLTDKILVDQTGMRYTDESYGGMSYVSSMQAKRDTDSFTLFDSSDADVAGILEKGLESDTVFKGDTWEEVAEAAGIDAAALAETVDTYNASAEAGADEAFGKPAEKMTAYAKAPFYAVRVEGNLIGTYGGVKTDMESHVLNENGEIIEGLYALGEMSNREYYNESYVPCASLTIYSTVARLLGSSLEE